MEQFKVYENLNRQLLGTVLRTVPLVVVFTLR
jgi:hypothetical protein